MINGQCCGKCVHFYPDSKYKNNIGEPKPGQCRGGFPQLVVTTVERMELIVNAITQRPEDKPVKKSNIRSMFPPMIDIDPGCGYFEEVSNASN